MRKFKLFSLLVLAAVAGCHAVSLEMPAEFKAKKLKEDPPMGYNLGGDDLAPAPTPLPAEK